MLAEVTIGVGVLLGKDADSRSYNADVAAEVNSPGGMNSYAMPDTFHCLKEAKRLMNSGKPLMNYAYPSWDAPFYPQPIRNEVDRPGPVLTTFIGKVPCILE